MKSRTSSPARAVLWAIPKVRSFSAKAKNLSEERNPAKSSFQQMCDCRLRGRRGPWKDCRESRSEDNIPSDLVRRGGREREGKSKIPTWKNTWNHGFLISDCKRVKILEDRKQLPKLSSFWSRPRSPRRGGVTSSWRETMPCFFHLLQKWKQRLMKGRRGLWFQREDYLSRERSVWERRSLPVKRWKAVFSSSNK